jgi:hypothetical protein
VVEIVVQDRVHREHLRDGIGNHSYTIDEIAHEEIHTVGTKPKFKQGFRVQDCHVSATERCDMAKVKEADLTNIYPGGRTRCLLSDAPEYFFQVYSGSTENLLIYFQGGGACWDQGSTNMAMCKFRPDKQCICGLFDRKHRYNPYKDWTMLHILYCSGDAHAGDVARNWQITHNGKPVRAEGRGYPNAASAINWAKKNIGNVKNLAIMGCSAGSMGAQMWASKLLNDFSYQSAVVVADSYAGIFPPGVQGEQMASSGTCTTGLLSPALEAKCKRKQTTVQEVFLNAMRSFPNVAFVLLNGKTDKVQEGFYQAIYLSYKGTPAIMTDGSYYEMLQKIESYYARQHNFILYDVNSGDHCYTNTPWTFTTTAAGSTGHPAAINDFFDWSPRRRQSVHLSKWLGSLPVQPGNSVSSQCSGESGLPGAGGTNFNGFQYCEPKARYHRFKARDNPHVARR